MVFLPLADLARRFRPASSRRSGWFLLFSCLIALPAAGQIRPSLVQSREFARQLEIDYAKSGPKALLDRIDHSAMAQSWAESFGATEQEEEQLAKELTINVTSALDAILASLSQFPQLVVSRILTVENERQLECLFSSNTKGIFFYILTLKESSSGRITLHDLRSLTDKESFLTINRQMLILMGTTAHAPLSGSEEDLAFVMRGARGAGRLCVALMMQKNYNDAFAAWLRLPAAIQPTRAWREIRDRLAHLGSVKASGHLGQEMARGPVSDSAFSRYVYFARRGNLEESIAAIDQALEQNYQMPALQTLKMEDLLSLSRLDEAEAIARRIRELDPLLYGGYLGSIRVAIRRGQPEKALEETRQAARLIPLEDLHALLSTDAQMYEFLKSPSYLEWRKTRESRPTNH